MIQLHQETTHISLSLSNIYFTLSIFLCCQLAQYYCAALSLSKVFVATRLQHVDFGQLPPEIRSALPATEMPRLAPPVNATAAPPLMTKARPPSVARMA